MRRSSRRCHPLATVPARGVPAPTPNLPTNPRPPCSVAADRFLFFQGGGGPVDIIPQLPIPSLFQSLTTMEVLLSGSSAISSAHQASLGCDPHA
eukprot:773177-Prymnesium_polylepis.1